MNEEPKFQLIDGKIIQFSDIAGKPDEIQIPLADILRLIPRDEKSLYILRDFIDRNDGVKFILK